jgi:hypothetical protein
VNFREIIEVGRYRVKSLLLPNCVNTIESGINNAIYFSSGGTSYKATITPGIYTSSTIAAAVQTACNAQLAGFTVTYSGTTNKLSFSNAATFYFNFSQSTGDDCATMLGFVAATDTAASTSITAPNVINLVRVPAFYIDIREADHRVMSSYGTCTGTLYYPLQGSNGSYAVYLENDFPRELTITQNSNQLNVKLLDSQMQDLLNNGADFELLLQKI